MEVILRAQTRHELIQQMVPRYREASVAQKRALLDEIAATTGYARRYAMWLLNHLPERQHASRRRRQPQYGLEVQQALFLVWQAANQICSKRLMPFLPTLIEILERIASRDILPRGKILASFPFLHLGISSETCICFEPILNTTYWRAPVARWGKIISVHPRFW